MGVKYDAAEGDGALASSGFTKAKAGEVTVCVTERHTHRNMHTHTQSRYNLLRTHAHTLFPTVLSQQCVTKVTPLVLKASRVCYDAGCLGVWNMWLWC